LGSIGVYGIQAQHPDQVIALLLDDAPELVCAAVKAHRESLKNPSKTVSEYLGTLERVGLTVTAGKLRLWTDAVL
jgi:hypothetical protein